MHAVAALNTLVVVLPLVIALSARATETPTASLTLPRGSEPSNGPRSHTEFPGGRLPKAALTGSELGPGGSLPSSTKNVCAAFQKYKSCHGTKRRHCGDRSCKTRFNLRPQCSKKCVPGCYCRSGLYRNTDGSCVSFFKCGSWIKSLKEKLQSIFKGRAE